MPHQPHCVYRQRSPVKTKCRLKQQTTNYSIILSILFTLSFTLLTLPSLLWTCLYARVLCVFDYLTALPWFMCLGPVRAVLSLCEKNHSFPRVEDERVFRLQTPVGLCGLDCLSLFLHHRVIYFFKKNNKTVLLWRQLSRDGRDMVRSWTISLIKTLSFCIIDLAWAANRRMCVCVCVCESMKTIFFSA